MLNSTPLTKHKLLILSRLADEYRARLREANLPGLEIAERDVLPSDCDIVFGEPVLIKPVMSDLLTANWIQSTFAGVDPLLDPALRRDYVLTNMRGVFGGLMSEFVVGYLLLHERKILQRLEGQKKQQWDATLTGTLHGKTIGLLGVGSIGREVARTAKFFGMTVRGYTRASENSEHIDQYFHGEGLLEFASGLDYLVNILPNTNATRKIVNAELLSRLPSHALFINVGRGSAVEQSALIQALETGAIAGAVLDVFEVEPLPAGHPFWSAPNTIVTSHSSAPSFPAEITKVFIENYRLYVEQQPLKYQVDFEKGY
ncbi:MAG: D-2-hydroxyacid dehydrogenase [Chloroflexi bacterium HGW-Chloroflexi-6]|nr:MAG: D-2-hydroxyacid dehydrogenase [Chloroflexi bacterium HGW-Chloroflexi-6]